MSVTLSDFQLDLCSFRDAVSGVSSRHVIFAEQLIILGSAGSVML